MKWQVCILISALYQNITSSLRNERMLLFELQDFLCGATFLLERIVETTISQTWVFGSYFLKNESNEPVISRKITNSEKGK